MSGKYALIIGNSEYTDPGLARLSAPGKDAEAFARVLRSKDICAFDEVQSLVNEPEPVVRDAIDGFFDQKLPDDLLVLYFSGHGVRDEYGSLYLAVTNTNRQRLRATAIKSEFIRESMDLSRSRRQVLILDCCNSGAFAQGTKAATGVSIGTALAFEGTGYGRVVLTASDSTQFAWEGDKVIGETENSLFTHFLVKGLEGEADGDGDGRITIDELYDYAYEQIVNVTPKQTPGKWSYKQQGEIVLRQSTRLEDIKPVQLPDDLLDEIEDTRPYVREAAVQKLARILQGRNAGMARSAKGALEKIAADENTTRRVAEAATRALEGYQQEQNSAQSTNQNKEAVRDEKPLAADDAAARLRAREVTEQIAAQDAERARLAKVKKDEERAAEKRMAVGRTQKWAWPFITPRPRNEDQASARQEAPSTAQERRREIHPNLIAVVTSLAAILVIFAVILFGLAGRTVGPFNFSLDEVVQSFVVVSIGVLIALAVYWLTREHTAWNIGRREVIGMVVGTALYAISLWLRWSPAIAVPAFSQVAIDPTIVIPMIVGYIFGPVAGFFTGAVGPLFGQALAGYGITPQWSAGGGLVGLIAGLALIFGKEKKPKNTVLWICGGVVLIATALFLLNPDNPNALYYDPDTGKFGQTTLTVFAGIALLIDFILVLIVQFAFRNKNEVAAAITWAMLGTLAGNLFAALSEIWLYGLDPVAAVVSVFLPAAGTGLLFAAILVPLLIGAYAATQNKAMHPLQS